MEGYQLLPPFSYRPSLQTSMTVFQEHEQRTNFFNNLGEFNEDKVIVLSIVGSLLVGPVVFVLFGLLYHCFKKLLHWVRDSVCALKSTARRRCQNGGHSLPYDNSSGNDRRYRFPRGTNLRSRTFIAGWDGEGDRIPLTPVVVSPAVIRQHARDPGRHEPPADAVPGQGGSGIPAGSSAQSSSTPPSRHAHPPSPRSNTFPVAYPQEPLPSYEATMRMNQAAGML